MKAILRQVRISSKKAGLVANLVRNKRAEDAVNILRFTTKKAAPMIRKVIQSAMANAENNFKQNRANLFVKDIVVTEGTTYKRGIHISRGRSHPILKRTAHISVSLENRAYTEPKTAKSAKKKDQEVVATEEKEAKSAKEPEVKKTGKSKSNN